MNLQQKPLIHCIHQIFIWLLLHVEEELKSTPEPSYVALHSFSLGAPTGALHKPWAYEIIAITCIV